MDDGRRGSWFPWYYGWVMLAVAIVSGSFSTGVGVWGASVLARPMTAALGWSRASYFGGLTIRSFVAGGLAPWIGPMLDTPNGPRRLMLLSGVVLGVSLLLTTYVTSLWQFYLLFGLLGGIAQATGANSIQRAVLPKWFVRRRGRVQGLASMGPGLGPMLYPIGIQAIITASGDWRTAWTAMGFLALGVLVPLSFLVRTKPEDMGLLPDGERPAPVAARTASSLAPSSAQAPASASAVASADAAKSPTPVATPPAPTPTRAGLVEGRSLTRSEALRTPAFWLLVAAFMMTGLGTGGFHANLVTYFQDIGLTAAVAALSGTAFAVCSVSMRPVWGLLAERIHVRYLIGPQLILSALTVYLILNVAGQTSMFIAVGLHGVAIGAFIALQGLLVANYFGRENLGAIDGILRPFMTIAGASSPLIVAFLFELQGTYTLAFLVVAAGWACSGALMLLIQPPRASRGV